MPRRPAPKDATAKRMVSWRENEDVYQAAVAIAEAEDQNKQTAFSALFRNGIALHDLREEVRSCLKETRAAEIERLANSKDKWLRKEAKSRRTMLTLYEPTDSEVVDFIRIAVKERMYGKIQRPEATTDNERNEDAPLFADGIEAVNGASPEIGEGTVVIRVGEDVAVSADSISVMYRNDDGQGDACSVNLGGGTLFQVNRIEAGNLLDDGLVAKVSIQGDLAYIVGFSSGGLTCERSFLDARSGEYGPFTQTHDYLGVPTPDSVVLMWRDGAVRIDSNGATCYKTGTPTDVEADRIAVDFAGYAIICDDGADDLQVLHV